MDIREQFYEWLLSNKLHKVSKVKEAISVLEVVDEKCVRSKGDGRFSLFDFVDLGNAKHIQKTFLITNQINMALGKNAKIFHKNIGFLFEFYDELASNQSISTNGEQGADSANKEEDASCECSDSVPEDLPNIDEALSSETTTEHSVHHAEKELNDTNPVLRVEKEKILVKKVNNVFSKISKKLSLVSKEKIDTVHESESVYFDLINAQLGIKSQGKIKQRRIADVYLDNGHVYDESESVFLQRGKGQEKLSVYNEVFFEVSKNSVIEKAISHSLKNSNLENKGLYAMIPDVLDEFAKEIRRQLIYKGERVFPIPRSIAYALGTQCRLNRDGHDYSAGSEVIFLDYDGNEFVAIQLDVVDAENESVNYSIFVRKGIKKISGEHLDYNRLFDFCREAYEKKYGIIIEDSIAQELKMAKTFSSLFNTHEPIILKQSSGYIKLIYDPSIHNMVKAKIQADVDTISEETGIDHDWLIIGSSLYGTEAAEFLGCNIVQNRIKNQKPLWKEYLPQLSLEVIENGRYSEIELIRENEYRDVLKTLGEEEIIYVNGKLTFGKEKDYYSLPLERNIENDINKEKQCVFKHPSFPLKDSVSVSLEIHYKYGDENSYKLVAKPITKNAPFDKIESEWVDREALPLGKVSKFVSNGGMLPRDRDVERIKKSFDALIQKLNYYENCHTRSLRERMILPTKDENGKDNKKKSGIFLHMYNTYAAKRRVFNSMAYNIDMNARGLIDSLFESNSLLTLYDIATGNSEWNQYFETDIGNAEASKIRDDAREFISDLGYMYERFVCDEIVDYFVKLKKLRYLAPISRCLETDSYGVYAAISKKIVDDGLDDGRIRSLAANCNYIRDWANNLYNTECGPAAMNIVRDAVFELITNYRLDQKTVKNPRYIRDYMELLVCICAVNEIDNEFINPNDNRTKKLVKKIKEIDIFMEIHKDEMIENKKPFVCRLQTDAMDKQELYGMNDLTFMLVQILTGAQDINLTGFDDNE
jgi:hypothetical protein